MTDSDKVGDDIMQGMLDEWAKSSTSENRTIRLVGEAPQVKWIKTHPDAKLPTLAHAEDFTGDTGYDVYAVEHVTIPSLYNVHADGFQRLEARIHIPSAVVPIGLEVAYITPGYWFKVSAKSGLGFKFDLMPHPGIIDNGYRGDCGIKVYNFGPASYTFNKGDKIAQLVIYELHHAEMSWADEKIESKRGAKGYGSTGK